MVQEAERCRDKEKVKIEAKNGLENYSVTTRTTLTEEKVKDKCQAGDQEKLEKIFEVPGVQFIESAVDVLMDVESHGSSTQVAQKTVELQEVRISVVMRRQGSIIQAVQQTADVPHEDVPVFQQRPFSIEKVQKSRRRGQGHPS